MTLLAGSCSIAADRTVTGTGLAKDLADVFVGAFPAILALLPDTTRTGTQTLCNGLAAAIVNHIAANAAVSVVVHTTDTGLQRTPNPNNANTDTQGPSGNKTLTGTIA